MQAIVLREFGPPSVLALETVRDAVARPGETVVELRAAALNWHDTLVRRGAYATTLPHVLGADGAGVDRATGAEVVVLPSLRWGADERAPSSAWEILGDRRSGTYAELVSVPSDVVYPKPTGWTWSEAAALPLAGVTAYRALFSRAGLRHGETVAVLGAGGGVAGFCVAFARMAGARVLVTTSSAIKLGAARAAGASDGVLYTTDGWADELVAMAGPDGIDVVVDSVGSTLPDSLAAVRPGGRVVTFGATGASRATVDVRALYFSQASLLGTTMGSPGDFEALLKLLDSDRRWRPEIEQELTLDRAADAHMLMESGSARGKITLAV